MPSDGHKALTNDVADRLKALRAVGARQRQTYERFVELADRAKQASARGEDGRAEELRAEALSESANLEKLEAESKELLAEVEDGLVRLELEQVEFHLGRLDERVDSILGSGADTLRAAVEGADSPTDTLIHFVLALRGGEIPPELAELRHLSVEKELQPAAELLLYTRGFRERLTPPTGADKGHLPSTHAVAKALSSTLDLLARIDPRDVARGIRALEQSRQAARQPRHYRAIQSLVDRYVGNHPGWSARQLWDRLADEETREVTVDGVQFEVWAEWTGGGDWREIEGEIEMRLVERAAERPENPVTPSPRGSGLTFDSFRRYVTRSKKKLG